MSICLYIHVHFGLYIYIYDIYMYLLYLYFFIYLYYLFIYLFYFVLANNNFAPSNALQSLQVWVHVIYHPHIQNNIVQLVQVHPYLHLRTGHNNHDIFQLFGYLGNQWVNIILHVLCLQPALFCRHTQDSPSLRPTTGLTIWHQMFGQSNQWYQCMHLLYGCPTIVSKYLKCFQSFLWFSLMHISTISSW